MQNRHGEGCQRVPQIKGPSRTRSSSVELHHTDYAYSSLSFWRIRDGDFDHSMGTGVARPLSHPQLNAGRWHDRPERKAITAEVYGQAGGEETPPTKGAYADGWPIRDHDCCSKFESRQCPKARLSTKVCGIIDCILL
jgi:hypothetical protein